MPTFSAVAKDIRPDGFKSLWYFCLPTGANLHGRSNPTTFSCPRCDKIVDIFGIKMFGEIYPTCTSIINL